MGRFLFDQVRHRAPNPLDLNVLAFLAPERGRVFLQAMWSCYPSPTVRGSEPMYTNSRRGITGPHGLQRLGRTRAPRVSVTAWRRGTPCACSAGAPAVIAFTRPGLFLLFLLLCFSLVRLLVPGLSLFPGPCFFPDCDFLQDVVGYPTWVFHNRGSVWDVDTAMQCMNRHSVQRIRRHVRDCTHPN